MNLSKYAALVFTVFAAGCATTPHSSAADKPNALSIPVNGALPVVNISRGDEVEILSSKLMDTEKLFVVHCANGSGICSDGKVTSAFYPMCTPTSVRPNWSDTPDRCDLLGGPMPGSGRLVMAHDGQYVFIVVKNDVFAHRSNLAASARFSQKYDFPFLYFGTPEVLAIQSLTRDGDTVRLSYGINRSIALRFVHHTNSATARSGDVTGPQLSMLSVPIQLYATAIDGRVVD